MASSRVLESNLLSLCADVCGLVHLLRTRDLGEGERRERSYAALRAADELMVETLARVVVGSVLATAAFLATLAVASG